jgi:hypothetical protein
MKKYNIEFSARIGYEIEAESEEAALDIARDKLCQDDLSAHWEEEVVEEGNFRDEGVLFNENCPEYQ